MNYISQRPLILIFFCASLILLSLPPFGISIFYWISLSLFFLYLLNNNDFSKKIVFLFFFIFQFISLIWIVQSFYSGGSFYLILGIILVLALTSFISLINFFAVFLTYKVFKFSQLNFFLLPLSLSTVELFKEFFLGGFPWNPAAIIYYKNIWVLKLLPYVGVYGLGVIIHLILGAFLYSIVKTKKILTYFIAVLILLISTISFFEKDISELDSDETLNIVLVQPNIYESLSAYNVLENFEKYEEITLNALSQNSNTDLIIWPEGSLPIDLNNRIGLLKRIGGLLDKGQLIIVGSSAITNNQLFNRLFVIDHEGKINQYYDKQKLVLFGEYVPWVKPLLSKFLNLGMNYNSGKDQPILKLPKNVNAIPMICFE